ncbi:prohead core scaffold and protease [uncultured Mediterranean phage]|nr:prohead core scaffold and protease [uncultured Mediterranean phage]
MKLITETIESIEVLTEEKANGKKDYKIRGVFMQADIKNRNGRIYPVETLAKEVKRYTNEFINKKRAFGELGHPDGPTVNLERVSHMITSLKPEGKNFIGEAKVMDTPYGKIVKNLIDEGAQLGVSSRGMGSIQQMSGRNVVGKDFYLATAADIVADPSAPDAFVEGIMEGKEWVWDNGILKSMEVEQYKEEIERTKRKELAEVKANIFKNFLSKV